MAITDSTRKSENQGTGGSITVTLNSTVVGNTLVFGASIYNSNSDNMTTSTLSDTANTFAALSRHVTSAGVERQGSQIWSCPITTGGNRTLTFDPGTSNYDFSVYVHEFTGVHATPSSGTPVNNQGGAGTTADSTAFTPGEANCLIVSLLGNSATGTITENVNTGGGADTDWTLSNDHESGSSAEPGSMVFFIQSGGPTARRAKWTIPTGTFWAVTTVGLKSSGGLSATVNQVSETDTAQAITWAPKHRLVNQVSESDLAQAMTRVKLRTLTQVNEQDLAQAIAWAAKHRLVNQVSETNTAQALTRVKTLAIGQVAELDLAQTITVADDGEQIVSVDQTSEIDLAQSINRLKTKALGQVAETDLSQTLTVVKTRTLGQVSETDLAQAIAWAPKHRLIQQVLESDLAQTITVVGGIAVSRFRLLARKFHRSSS